MGKTRRRADPVFVNPPECFEKKDEHATTAIEDEEGFRCTDGVNKARRWETMKGAFEAHSVRTRTRKGVKWHSVTYAVPRTGEDAGHDEGARTKQVYQYSGRDDDGHATYEATYRLQCRPPALTDEYRLVKYARFSVHNRRVGSRPLVRTGTSWWFAKGDALDVDLGSEKRVRVVSTQGSAPYDHDYVRCDASSLVRMLRNDFDSYVHTYRLWYRSRTVRKWTEVGVFEGNSGVGLERAHRVDITARYLRFEPLGWDGGYKAQWTPNTPQANMRVGIYVNEPPSRNDTVEYTMYTDNVKGGRLPDGFDKYRSCPRNTFSNIGGKALVRPPCLAEHVCTYNGWEPGDSRTPRSPRRTRC